MTSDHEMMGQSALRDATIAAAVTDWFVRQAGDTMSGDDWIAFSDWLGADPRHAAAFDALVAVDGKLDALDRAAIARPTEAEEPVVLAWRRWGPALGAIAAVLVLALLLFPGRQAPQWREVATAPGEVRTLALTDTIRVELNGATRLSIDARGGPRVRVDSGEAAFFVSGPKPSTLKVEADGLTLVDRGTSFDVIRDANGVRVAVGSGRVTINPAREAIDLVPGDTFRLAKGHATAERGRIAPAAMAGWRDGRLDYAGTPASLVVADLSRALGVRIDLAPPLSQKRFTGAIPTRGKPAQVIVDAAQLLGGVARRAGEGWTIGPR